MRKLILFVAVMVVGSGAWGQIYPIYGGTWNFENNPDRIILYRDTISNPNCKWQIGKPNKTVFTSAYQNSLPNAIVTDTLNPVPANDTSVFYIKFLRQNFIVSFLSFNYMMNGDSNDFGMVEVSPDSGKHWINILAEDTTYNIGWLSGVYTPGIIPKLNGSTNGWKLYFADMNNWYYSFSGYPVLWNHNIPGGIVDTILFRFTYITDSGSAPHDGWMIDDITAWDYFEGINETPTSSIYLSPNPTTGIITFTGITQPTIAVYNLMGQKVVAAQNSNEVSLAHLPAGMYLVQVFNKDMELVKSEKVILNR